MGARWKVLVVAAAVACAFALVACSPSGGSSSAGSASSSSSGSGSAVVSSSSASGSASSSSASAPSSGGTATIDLDYSAGTGYEWEYTADPEGVVELVSQDTGGASSDPTVSGGPLQDHFTFSAKAPGEVVITFDLVRNWEPDSPAETQVYAFTVTDDLQMILNPYKSDFANEPTIE